VDGGFACAADGIPHPPDEQPQLGTNYIDPLAEFLHLERRRRCDAGIEFLDDLFTGCLLLLGRWHQKTVETVSVQRKFGGFTGRRPTPDRLCAAIAVDSTPNSADLSLHLRAKGHQPFMAGG